MRTQRRVFEKLSETTKVELASEKIELSDVDDLKKLNTLYYKNTDTANSKIKGLLSEARSAETKIEEALKAANKMDTLISKVQKIAKELGIDENRVEELKDAKIAVKDAKEYKSVLKTIKQFIKTI
jgi:predicted DNA-binding ArsR family transcriptional regulator